MSFKDRLKLAQNQSDEQTKQTLNDQKLQYEQAVKEEEELRERLEATAVTYFMPIAKVVNEALSQGKGTIKSYSNGVIGDTDSWRGNVELEYDFHEDASGQRGKSLVFTVNSTGDVTIIGGRTFGGELTVKINDSNMVRQAEEKIEELVRDNHLAWSWDDPRANY